MNGDGQTTLFDVAGAARDHALDAVEQAAGDEWNGYAYQFVCDYLRAHRTLFPDDLWTDGLVEPPNDRRALGPVLLRCARAGYMCRTGDTRPSVQSHLTPKAVWRSIIYAGDL